MISKTSVTVYEWYLDKEEKIHKKRTITEDGIFKDFGIDFQEVENGVGQFSTAIVQVPTGELINVPVELVKFNNVILPKPVGPI